MKPFQKLGHSEVLEATQVRILCADDQQSLQFVEIFWLGQDRESLGQQDFEVNEEFRVESPEDLGILLREFKRRALEVEVPWGSGEGEPKINVHDAPIRGQKDVPVVPVLD